LEVCSIKAVIKIITSAIRLKKLKNSSLELNMGMKDSFLTRLILLFGRISKIDPTGVCWLTIFKKG